MSVSLKQGNEGTRGGETVSDIVYERIRKDILFGRLRPRERLKLDAFGQRYGAGVSTMRELLNRLGSEGWIVAEGQRGFEVAPVSAGEFREIAAMRLLLECHALRLSFQMGDLDWESGVVAAHHKLSVTESRMLREQDADPELWKNSDREFHQALIGACGSRVLLQTHAAIYDKYLRYQMIAVIFRGEIAAREHALLLECCLARDAQGACDILETHINSCVEYAVAAGNLDLLDAPKPRPAHSHRGP